MSGVTRGGGQEDGVCRMEGWSAVDRREGGIVVILYIMWTVCVVILYIMYRAPVVPLPSPQNRLQSPSLTYSVCVLGTAPLLWAMPFLLYCFAAVHRKILLFSKTGCRQ